MVARRAEQEETEETEEPIAGITAKERKDRKEGRKQAEPEIRSPKSEVEKREGAKLLCGLRRISGTRQTAEYAEYAEGGPGIR